MARAAPLRIESLIALGAERLAELALGEAETNAAFGKLLTAAVAASRGPDAVAAIVDKRLAALERATGAVSAGRQRAFVADLSATLKIITGDLARADAESALRRLLRLIATADRTLDRLGYDGGGAARVFSLAAAALPALLSDRSGDESQWLADGLTTLAADQHSAAVHEAVPAILAAAPAGVVADIDARLAGALEALGPLAPDGRDWSLRARVRRLIALRQVIADLRGDVDAFIALEAASPGGVADAAAIGARLIEAGRAAEALDWLRRPARPAIKMLRMADFHLGIAPRDPGADQRAQVEIQALEALGDRQAAQTVRWRIFTETLDVAIMRERIARMPDFEDVDALDEAFAHALSSKLIYAALHFLVEWPRLDLAERLAVERRKDWDGKRHEALAPAAEALNAKHPLGAVILYRALLDSILNAGLSVAYGHAARYYAELEGLESREAPDWPIEPHRHYRAELIRRHGRKAGFWTRVEGTGSR